MGINCPREIRIEDIQFLREILEKLRKVPIGKRVSTQSRVRSAFNSDPKTMRIIKRFMYRTGLEYSDLRLIELITAPGARVSEVKSKRGHSGTEVIQDIKKNTIKRHRSP